MTLMNIIKKTAHSLHKMGMKQYFWNLMINGILMSYLIPVSIRRYTLNILGANVKGAIHGHCTLLSSRLTLGSKSFINRNCFIDNNATVTIGNNCAIGYNVVIATTNHSMGCSSKRGGYYVRCQLRYKMVVGLVPTVPYCQGQLFKRVA